MSENGTSTAPHGVAVGPYEFRIDLGEARHVRRVRWVRCEVPRSAFGQDILYSLGSLLTVFGFDRNNAEERVKTIMEGRDDPGFTPKPGISPVAVEQIDTAPVDIEQVARDQIRGHLQTHFHGHDLSQLVDALLHAEGYTTKFSLPGPDGGADILAARAGPLGTERPYLCVQVKSTRDPADVRVLRELQGTMSTFKADQGLLMSWSGFNSAVEKEARLSFFSVRLWDADDLIEAIFRNYDRLPEDLRSELPLKRVWALVLEEGE